MNNKKLQKFNHSLGNAVAGLFSALRTEKNLRVHIIATAGVILLGLLLKITLYEWIALILIISLVIISELFNTALEISVDYFSPEENAFARKIKDVSAAAVLIAALSSILLGILIFGKRLLTCIGLI